MYELKNLQQLKEGQQIARVNKGSLTNIEILEYVCPHPYYCHNSEYIFVNKYSFKEEPISIKKETLLSSQWYLFDGTHEDYLKLYKMMIQRLESLIK